LSSITKRESERETERERERERESNCKTKETGGRRKCS